MVEGLEEIFSEISFEGDMRFVEPMMKHTSLRIGGPADVFAIPQDIPSLKNMLIILKRQGIPFLPLGSGTNVLIRDEGIEGVDLRDDRLRPERLSAGQHQLRRTFSRYL